MRDGRETFAGEADDARRAVPVLNARFMYDPGEHMALRVRHDVALAALDLLAGVEAAQAAGLRGLDALAIESGWRTASSAGRRSKMA